jgi:hypothetical protein
MRRDKLSEHDVVSIRTMHHQGVSQKDLQVIFDLPQYVINKVVLGKTFKDVGGQILRPRKKKLTANDVIEIRRLSKEGKTQREIGDKFGIHRSNVYKINEGEIYAWVEKEN